MAPSLRSGLALAVVLGLLAAAPSPAQGLLGNEDRRLETYDRFRALFAAGNYQEALPLAKLLVSLTADADPKHEELPTAYNNLGVVQFRVGDLESAESSFETALDLLERTDAISSRRLISPLAGLGAVYASTGQPARAADALHRAIAISRRASGLFNVDQLGLVEALIEAYETLGNTEGIERERRYEVQIVQQAYGPDDPRTIPIVSRFAEWLEKTDRWAAARVYWAKVVEIGMSEGDGRNAATIDGLLGITRSHRLQYVRDPESLSQSTGNVDPLTGRPDPLSISQERVQLVKLDSSGEKAAVRALEILDSIPSPPPVLLARTLLEIGDWYMTEHRPDQAIPYYQRAWPLLSEEVDEGRPNPLLQPRPLHYRAPAAASRSLTRARAPAVARPVEFTLTVTASGETTDVTAVSDAPEGQVAQIRRALERAWFSPRFEDGMPVPTTGHRFVEHWFEAQSEEERHLDTTESPSDEALSEAAEAQRTRNQGVSAPSDSGA